MKDQNDKVTPDFPDMEGDFVYRSGLSPATSEETKAFEESYFHQTLVDFERLMYRHGLVYLIDHMSENAGDELLAQAHKEFHNRTWSDAERE